jgi:hypothetical protein
MIFLISITTVNACPNLYKSEKSPAVNFLYEISSLETKVNRSLQSVFNDQFKMNIIDNISHLDQIKQVQIIKSEYRKLLKASRDDYYQRLKDQPSGNQAIIAEKYLAEDVEFQALIKSYKEFSLKHNHIKGGHELNHQDEFPLILAISSEDMLQGTIKVNGVEFVVNVPHAKNMLAAEFKELRGGREIVADIKVEQLDGQYVWEIFIYRTLF